jgi:hypothetical protein
MPYIKSDDYGCTPRFDRPAANVGELTFQVTCVVQQYLIEHGLEYQRIAEITGALAQAQRDFDERVVVPYEHLKCLANGDVWKPLIRAGIVPL